jgi:biopolymer transport protein ExbD
MPHIKRREIKKTKIEIIPMIDTMFFLLVFFILASLNVLDVNGKQVKLPNSTNQDRQARAQLTITIKKGAKAGDPGEVWVNKKDQVASPEQLGPPLIQALQGMTDPINGGQLQAENAVVVINADQKASYSLIRRCIDAARLVRFRKFSMATDPKFGSSK